MTHSLGERWCLLKLWGGGTQEPRTVRVEFGAVRWGEILDQSSCLAGRRMLAVTCSPLGPRNWGLGEIAPARPCVSHHRFLEPIRLRIGEGVQDLERTGMQPGVISGSSRKLGLGSEEAGPYRGRSLPWSARELLRVL